MKVRLVPAATGPLLVDFWDPNLEIVRLVYQDWVHGGSKNKDLMTKISLPQMALRIGPLKSSALQNDGLVAPVILQCRTPQENNPKGRWGPN